MEILCSNSQVTNQDVKSFGGKASSLWFLSSKGFNVPPWIAFRENIDSDLLTQSLNRFFRKHQNGRFAVRSSANCEDGKKHSFAGIFESELNLSTQEVKPAIERIVNSKKSERVLSYCQQNDLAPSQIELNVIVQVMLDSDKSGVGFSYDPTRVSYLETNQKSVQLINAVYGQGEGLVSKGLVADSYRIKVPKDKLFCFLDIEKIIEAKVSQYRLAETGLELHKVEKSLSSVSVLSKKEVQEVSKLVDRVEQVFAYPVDIEFSYQKNHLYLLQARPITTPTPIRSHFELWDNSNLSESYPGLSLPLTVSFVQYVYSVGYKNLCSAFGVYSWSARAKEFAFKRILDHRYGRLYYNVGNVSQLIELLPFDFILKKAFEQATGVRGFRKIPIIHSLGISLLQFPSVLIAFFLNLVRLPGMRSRFVTEMTDSLDQSRNLLDRIKKESKHDKSSNLKDLLTTYRDLEQKVLSKWITPIVSGLYAIGFFYLGKQLVQRLTRKESSKNLFNDLLTGIGNVESAKIAQEFDALVEKLSKKTELRDSLMSGQVTKFLVALEKFSDIQQAYVEYLNRYGDRCIGGELKMENPSYRLDPSLFFKSLREAALAKYQSKTDSESKVSPESIQKGSNFRDMLRKELPGYRRIFLGPLTWLIEQCRELVRFREKQRFMRAQAFGLAKELFWEIGKVLAREQVLIDEKDVFYLSREQILGLDNLHELELLRTTVDTRKKLYESFQEVHPETRLISWQEENQEHIAPNLSLDSSTRSQADSDEFYGTACCSGYVKAKVKIVRNPSEIESLENQILVTQSTDPAWVKLFQNAAGVLQEQGSILGHTGIVTREMGIPSIVGLRGITRKLRDGDLVEFDGTQGKVKILQRCRV